MTKSTNYQLNQWAKSDRVMMDDFNADNAKIDAALKANADAIMAAGNCRMNVQTYTGTGTYGAANPTQITFPVLPHLFIIRGPRTLLIGSGGSATAFTVIYMTSSNGTYAYDQTVTWNDNTMSIYHTQQAQSQMNIANETYYVYSFCAE